VPPPPNIPDNRAIGQRGRHIMSGQIALSLEDSLLKLVRLAEYSGDKNLLDAAVWALYQAWELREAAAIDPETLAMVAKLSMRHIVENGELEATYLS
jgi:hypothetical protein